MSAAEAAVQEGVAGHRRLAGPPLTAVTAPSLRSRVRITAFAFWTGPGI